MDKCFIHLIWHCHLEYTLSPHPSWTELFLGWGEAAEVVAEDGEFVAVREMYLHWIWWRLCKCHIGWQLWLFQLRKGSWCQTWQGCSKIQWSSIQFPFTHVLSFTMAYGDISQGDISTFHFWQKLLHSYGSWQIKVHSCVKNYFSLSEIDLRKIWVQFSQPGTFVCFKFRLAYILHWKILGATYVVMSPTQNELLS